MFNQDKKSRFAFLVIMALSIGLLFVGGNTTSANTTFQEKTKHWVWPVIGEITDTFGTRSGHHKGLDIAAPLGEETISVDQGIVTKSYYSSTYGHVVFISHPNGLETVYAHLSKRSVKEGDKVSIGQKIGEIGSTGVSTGAHLHFEVHNGEWNYEKNNAIDPLLTLDDKVLYASAQLNDKEKGHNEMKLAASEHLENSEEWQTVEHDKGKIAGQSIVVSKQNSDTEEILTIVKIEKGQTLWDIAVKFGVAIEAIMKWNNLDSALLKVDQELKVYQDPNNLYVVQPGDSLERISKEVGVTVNEIRTLNQLEGDLIFPLQVLIINK